MWLLKERLGYRGTGGAGGHKSAGTVPVHWVPELTQLGGAVPHRSWVEGVTVSCHPEECLPRNSIVGSPRLFKMYLFLDEFLLLALKSFLL
jgi:hypothetical protein